MPITNTVKRYVFEGYYHIYNHGIGEISIFKDEDDYSTFLYLLEEYLCERRLNKGKDRKNYFNRVSLLSFCLLEDHFHLLVKQLEDKVIDKFMKSVTTSYVMRFNNKYSSRGRLFESVYKARLLESEADLINVSKYIHLNPEPLSYKKSSYYPYSSIREFTPSPPNYLPFNFMKKEELLSLFKGTEQDYKFYLSKGLS